MKVRLLVPRATVGGPQEKGDVVEVSTAEAARMIEAGQAAPVRKGAKPETTTPKRPVEKAAK